MATSDRPSGADDALLHVQKQFIKHTPELRIFLFSLVADRSLVDDLLHSVFLAVTSPSASFDPQRPFLPWARGIAKNKALEAARDARRAPRALAPDVMELMAQDVPLLEPSPADVEHLSECVDELAPRTKMAIMLRYFEALMPPEIARRMSLTVNSVNVMLSRARTTLRDCLLRKSTEAES